MAVNREVGETLMMHEVKWGCVMSLWLFYFVNGWRCRRGEIKGL